MLLESSNHPLLGISLLLCTWPPDTELAVAVVNVWVSVSRWILLSLVAVAIRYRGLMQVDLFSTGAYSNRYVIDFCISNFLALFPPPEKKGGEGKSRKIKKCDFERL